MWHFPSTSTGQRRGWCTKEKYVWYKDYYHKLATLEQPFGLPLLHSIHFRWQSFSFNYPLDWRTMPYRLLVLINQPRQFTVLSVLIIGWSILILLPILGPTIIQTPERGSFYGLSGAWCWMGRRYRVERVVYLYVSIPCCSEWPRSCPESRWLSPALWQGWMFSALGFSFIIYSRQYHQFIAFKDSIYHPISSYLSPSHRVYDMEWVGEDKASLSSSYDPLFLWIGCWSFDWFWTTSRIWTFFSG